MALWSPELRGSERSFSRSLLFDSGVWSSLHGEATFLNFADSVCFVCYLLGFMFFFLISEERNINPAQPHHVVIYCGLCIIVINFKFFNTTLPNFLFSKYSILLERSFFFLSEGKEVASLLSSPHQDMLKLLYFGFRFLKGCYEWFYYHLLNSLQIEDCRTRYNGDADHHQRRKKFTFPARLICGDCYEVIVARDSCLNWPCLCFT